MALTANLTRIVAGFGEIHPGVIFELVYSSDILDLAAGEADVALRYAKAIADTRLVARKLSDIRSAFFATEGYVARHGRPEGLAGTAGHVFVGNRRWGARPGEAGDLRDRIGWRGEVREVADQETVEATVQAGMAIGLLPLGRAARLAGAVRLFDPEDPVTLHCWLVTSPAAHRRPEVRAFTAFFAPRYRAFLGAERRALLGDGAE